METTTKKIAVACFIGGVLCCLVALAVSPVYWWLGLLAGLAGGYLGYEFREVLAAVPIAWRRSTTEVSDLYKKVKGGVVAIWRFFSEPHPFLYLTLVIVAWLCYAMFNPIKEQVANFWAFLPLVFVVATTKIFMLLEFMAITGAKKSGHRFVCLLETEKTLDLKEQPITYVNAYRWMIIGLAYCVRVVVLFFVKVTRAITWGLLILILRFAWHLFKLVRSDKRVLCALDGTLGGAIAYVWLHAPAMSFFEQAALTLFGGLIGATLGVIDWEIISKRILHVAENTSA